MEEKRQRALTIVAKQRIEKQKNQLKMPKLKPSSIGLTLGVFLAILYTIRTIIIWLFPNFVVNLAKKVTYSMILIQPAVITADAFVIGIVIFFVAGLIWGIVFSWVYNLVGK